MSEPDNLHVIHGHPMPTRDHATLLASYHLLLELASECLPVSVRPHGETTFFEDWEVTRAAFVARLASTVRHLGYLAPSYSQLDGFALTRTLVDHVIAYAWVSADPKERLPAFLRSSFKDILAKDGRCRERGAAPLLGDAQRDHLSAYTRKVNRELPRLPRLSREADEYWCKRVRSSLPESLHIVNFQRLYGDIYDHFAAYDHPTTTGLQVFVHLAEEPVTSTVDGEPERDLVADLRPYWIAVFAFAEALIVSNLSSNRPRLQGLSRTLETIGTMRNLEREGRLAVAVTDDGTITIGVAAKDDDGESP
jgi:acyl carrier protein phosphodiesterase